MAFSWNDSHVCDILVFYFFNIYFDYEIWKRKLDPASNFRCMVANYSTRELNQEVSLAIKYMYSRVSWVWDGEDKLLRAVANWITQAVILLIAVFYLHTYKAEMIKLVCALIALSF